MTYAGLTIADKYALEDLKYRYGGEYSVYLRSTRCWTNIDAALAQIAEMEKALEKATPATPRTNQDALIEKWRDSDTLACAYANYCYCEKDGDAHD